jgi:predicted GNAT family acetyltransferase
MTDQVLRPDATGFSLAGGELTATGLAERTFTGNRVDFSVTAGLFGEAELDLLLADWSSSRSDDLAAVRSDDTQLVLPLRTQPVMLNSLPSKVRVQLSTPADFHEAGWQVVLRFRNQAGASLTWRASLPIEAFGSGWWAPLTDLMRIDGTDDAPGGASASPDVTVVHHADDEYYELLVDGRQAGLLVYHVLGGKLAITHAVIEETYRGRGLSWVLVGRALDDIRTRPVQVTNYCAVVRQFIQKNPQYADVLSTPRPA